MQDPAPYFLVCTFLFPCQGVHESGDYVSWFLGVRVSVVVDTRGIALYPCHSVANNSLEEHAVARPVVAIGHLLC